MLGQGTRIEIFMITLGFTYRLRVYSHIERRNDMTGKELIIYILQNNLEDVEFTDISVLFPNYYSIEKAAVKLNTGIETVRVLYTLGKLTGIEFNGNIYIYVKE